jgi:alkylation response protein AidB-like acyl-CoA dehydrogenase
MRFDLPDTAEQLRSEVARWVDRRVPARGSTTAFSPDIWREFVHIGLLDPSVDELHRCVGLVEACRHGMCGPVLEARLGVLADRSGTAERALADGRVVTSVAPSPAGATLVGWGAVADLVVDQLSGAVVSREPLPAVRMAQPMPHGWYQRGAAVTADPLDRERWLTGAAIIAGLARGALALAVEHTANRRQFGRQLASFQAVQFPLAECKILVDGLYLMVLDAADRADCGTQDRGTQERGTQDRGTQDRVTSALAWLAAVRCAEATTKASHQAFGALGFCLETGLVQLTWGMAWLRLTSATRAARSYLAAHRQRQEPGAAPGCLVLEAFDRNDP